MSNPARARQGAKREMRMIVILALGFIAGISLILGIWCTAHDKPDTAWLYFCGFTVCAVIGVAACLAPV
jgi:hypothetical protein